MQIENVIDGELFARFDEILLEVALNGMRDVKYCPRPKCHSRAVMNDDGHMGQCCKCHFVFCNYCGLAYHGESLCGDLSGLVLLF